MKKSIKRLITVLTVCAVSAFVGLASGCSMTDKIKEKIEQARCEHEWNDGEVIKEATCVEKGELKKTCTLCEKVETVEIPLTEHTEVTVAAVAATCTKDGLSSGVKCGVCDKVIVEQVKVPAAGHIEVRDAAVSPTCLTAGKTEGSHCAVCNEVLTAQESISATGHTIVAVEGYAPTCTESGLSNGSKCSVCDEVMTEQTEIAALGHNVETHVAQAATCTEIGWAEYQTCTRCDYTTYEEIPMLPCVDSDNDGNCDTCGKAFYEAMDYVEAPIVNLPTQAYTTDGVWYRVYLPEETEGPVMYYIQFVDNIGSNANGDNFNCIGIPSKNSLANGSYERAIYVGSSGTKFVKVEGIEFYYAPNDEYVDFCLTMGDELTNEAENISFTLTKNTVVASVWDSSSIKTDEKYQWEVYLLVAASE